MNEQEKHEVRKEYRAYLKKLARNCQKMYHLTIDAIKETAKKHGYAIAVHGSLNRDIDLIACPWTEDASDPYDFIEELKETIKEANPISICHISIPKQFPVAKPHGRLCWSFHLGGGPYIDLSVMPLIR